MGGVLRLQVSCPHQAPGHHGFPPTRPWERGLELPLSSDTLPSPGGRVDMFWFFISVDMRLLILSIGVVTLVLVDIVTLPGIHGWPCAREKACGV